MGLTIQISEITPPSIISPPPTPRPTRYACTEAASTGPSRSGRPGTPPDSGRSLTSRTAAVSGRPPSSSSSAAPNWAATTAPTAAMASSPATREIALLAPLATPALCCGTEPSTVLVSGATVIDSPSPNTSTAGSRSVR